MPVCARCEGEYIGIIAGLIAVWFVKPPYWLMAVLMLPMIIDGLIQAFTQYESTNWRRLITGMLFGFSITMIVLMFWIAVFRYGLSIGEGMRN